MRGGETWWVSRKSLSCEPGNHRWTKIGTYLTVYHCRDSVACIRTSETFDFFFPPKFEGGGRSPSLPCACLITPSRAKFERYQFWCRNVHAFVRCSRFFFFHGYASIVQWWYRGNNCYSGTSPNSAVPDIPRLWTVFAFFCFSLVGYRESISTGGNIP